MRSSILSLATLVVLCLLILGSQARQRKQKEGKLLSLFNIVTFPNDPCNAGSKNGTCYTKEECSTKGGTNDGACASGYGVCCSFAVKCGTTISENNTYFESGGSETGNCKLKLCPCNNNICQLRLDFETFVITGPSTGSDTQASDGKATMGIVGSGAAAGKDINKASKCLTDSFTVTNPSGSSPPTICGINSGEHMYVDSTTACNDLAFILGQSAIETTLATRSWSIRVTQYACDYSNLAPAGCTQYFWGDGTGIIKSYNWDGSYHLADQNQVACVRREKGNCRICYATAAYTDVQVSSSTADKFMTKSCCGYKGDGMGTDRDCIIIPSLSNKSDSKQLIFSNFCGQGGLATKSSVLDATKTKTICTKRVPFTLTFSTDTWEFKDEVKTTATTGQLQNGFKIGYEQSC